MAVLFGGVRLAQAGVQAVADDNLAGNMRGHRLVAPEQGEDVVPASEVVGRDDSVAVGLEHARYLPNETVGAGQVLDNLVCMDDVEGARGDGHALIEVGLYHLDTALTGLLDVSLDDFDPPCL